MSPVCKGKMVSACGIGRMAHLCRVTVAYYQCDLVSACGIGRWFIFVGCGLC